jgi:dienelactone hydrolase
MCVAGLALGAACGGDDGGGAKKMDLPAMSGGSGGLGGSVPPPLAGTMSPPPPAAGTGGIGVTKPPPAGTGGAAGMPMGGAGGMGGMAGDAAGMGGMAGDAAGMGGMAGDAAGMGGMAGTTTDPGDGYHREADPTMMTAMNKGEYTVEKYTSGFRAPQAYGGGTIYYPTDADPPFAAIAVVPGFTAYQNSIQDWGPFLASHGIITMTIDTVTTADPPASRADGLLDALDTIKSENDRAGSPLMGKVDVSRFGVAGWSMGGGGTLIAASKTPTLKAGVSFAAWGPTGGAMNKVPVLMFEATADPLAAGMSDGFYQQTPDSVPKYLFEVSGAGHDVANSPNNSGKIIGLYGLSWFKVFLEGDERYRQFLTAPKPSITTSNTKTNVM